MRAALIAQTDLENEFGGEDDHEHDVHDVEELCQACDDGAREHDTL